MELTLEPHSAITTGDQDIVSRAQAGDKSAFEILYRKHVGRVYGVCLRIVSNADRAEELTQQAFIRAWEMLGSFRGESAFSSWLHRIAVNVVLLDFRSERRRTTRVESTDDLEHYNSIQHTTAPSTSIDLENVIASLPQQARAIFVLHDIEGYQHNEIAALMELAIGTSKAQLHRARKLLKERLQQ